MFRNTGGCGPQPESFGQEQPDLVEQPQLDPFGQQQLDPYGQPPPTGIEMAQPSSIEHQVANTCNPTALGWENAAADAGAIAAARVGVYSHYLLVGFMSGVSDEATKAAARQAAKLAAKSIWRALESGLSLPKYGEEPGQIRPTPEFFAEYNRVMQTQAWKELIVYVEYRERHKQAMKQKLGPNASSVHRRDCWL